MKGDEEDGVGNPYHTDGESTMEKSAHDLSTRKLNEYLFKAVRYRHMDFELARFLIIKSILSP